MAFGVVSPLGGNENEVSEVMAAGGKLIDNEFVELSSKREEKDDCVDEFEVDMAAEAWASPLLSSGIPLKRLKLGSTESKSSLSEASSLPSSISLRDEGPGVHRPNEDVLALGELLLEPDSPVAVVRAGPRFSGRCDPEVRRKDDPTVALAEALRLPIGMIGSE